MLLSATSLALSNRVSPFQHDYYIPLVIPLGGLAYCAPFTQKYISLPPNTLTITYSPHHKSSFPRKGSIHHSPQRGITSTRPSVPVDAAIQYPSSTCLAHPGHLILALHRCSAVYHPILGVTEACLRGTSTRWAKGLAQSVAAEVVNALSRVRTPPPPLTPSGATAPLDTDRSTTTPSHRPPRRTRWHGRPSKLSCTVSHNQNLCP